MPHGHGDQSAGPIEGARSTEWGESRLLGNANDGPPAERAGDDGSGQPGKANVRGCRTTVLSCLG
jgi:hypothetical protein